MQKMAGCFFTVFHKILRLKLSNENYLILFAVYKVLCQGNFANWQTLFDNTQKPRIKCEWIFPISNQKIVKLL